MHPEDLILAALERSRLPENGTVFLSKCSPALCDGISRIVPGANLAKTDTAVFPQTGASIRVAVFYDGFPADKQSARSFSKLYRQLEPEGLAILLQDFDHVAAPQGSAHRGQYLNDLLRSARKSGFNPEFSLLPGEGLRYLICLKKHAIPQAKALQVYMNTVSQYLIDHEPS